MGFGNQIKKNERRKLEIIGLYEIIAGVIGIALTIESIGSISQFSFLKIILILIVVFLYTFSIYAGVNLFKYHENKILYSEIIQYLQIPKIGIFGFIFSFTAGISFFSGIDYTSDFLFKFHFNLLPSTELNFKADKSLVFFYINFIPVLIIYLIGKSANKIQEEEGLLEINE